MLNVHPLIRETMKRKAHKRHVIRGYVGLSEGGVTPIKPTAPGPMTGELVARS